MRKGLSLVVVLSVIISTLLLAGVAFAQATPAVTVADQAVAAGSVTVAKVVAAEAGWIVIHADNNGAPGADLGHGAVKAGETLNLVIKIDTTKATAKLYAMLHVDKGVVGTYEFPGLDVPVAPSVSPAFNVTGLTAAQATTVATATRAATAAATMAATATRAATAAAPTVAATATRAATTMAATATRAATTVAGTRTAAAPATLPTTGGGSMLVLSLLSLGGLSLLGGLGLNFARRNRR